jgi:hypothetical protein
MLEALENGVRGGKWFSLIDKVWKEDNLSAAWLKTTLNGGSPGMDGQTVRQFTAHLDKELKTLRSQLMDESYTPQPVRRCWIPKPASTQKRPLGIPAVRDRIEHAFGVRPLDGPDLEPERRVVVQVVVLGQHPDPDRVRLVRAAHLLAPPDGHHREGVLGQHVLEEVLVAVLEHGHIEALAGEEHRVQGEHPQIHDGGTVPCRGWG